MIGNDLVEGFLATGPWAVFGASTNREKFGNKVLRAYQHTKREVYPIHPVQDEIGGGHPVRPRGPDGALPACGIDQGGQETRPNDPCRAQHLGNHLEAAARAVRIALDPEAKVATEVDVRRVGHGPFPTPSGTTT